MLEDGSSDLYSLSSSLSLLYILSLLLASSLLRICNSLNAFSLHFSLVIPRIPHLLYLVGSMRVTLLQNNHFTRVPNFVSIDYTSILCKNFNFAQLSHSLAVSNFSPIAPLLLFYSFSHKGNLVETSFFLRMK